MKKRKVTFGFTEKEFEEGAHICQIYSQEDDRNNILTDYIISGLKADENTACFSEKENEQTLASFFLKNGFEYQEKIRDEHFTLSKTEEVYFKNDEFVPERMLSLLQEFYNNANKQNRKGARVIGEMLPQIQHLKGGNRLLEYECKVSKLLEKFPVTAVCQYDANKFDGATIMDILKVHPYMIVRGEIVNNPFFISPDDYLSGKITF